VEEEQLPGVAAEAARAGVGGGEGLGGGRLLELVEAALEDRLDRAVPGVAVIDGATAGGFEPRLAEPLAEANERLGGAEVIEDPMGEERVDHGLGGGADRLGLLQAPLGIAHEVGDGVRRQVLRPCGGSRGEAASGGRRRARALGKMRTQAAVPRTQSFSPVKRKGAE
jgi:hypothetical protein